MKTRVVSVQEITETKILALPNGEYKGIWGGYEVRVKINGALYSLSTEDGIRTPSAPCVVRIQNGIATVEVLR